MIPHKVQNRIPDMGYKTEFEAVLLIRYSGYRAHLCLGYHGMIPLSTVTYKV